MHDNLRCQLTAKDAQDSSSDRQLGLGRVFGRADLDALQAEQRNDHGAEAEQQSDDHQSPTGLDVNCTQTGASFRQEPNRRTGQGACVCASA